MNKIKKYFLVILLLELFFSYVPAYAQTPPPTYSGPEAQITQYLCTPNTVPASQTKNYGSGTGNNFQTAQQQQNAAFNNNNGGVLYQCINQIYKFAIIIAAVVGVFFIVIAGYIYMSAEGNAESSTKAKDILVTTVTSLIILMAGYVLLKQLNPDLIQFHNIQPPSVTITNLLPPPTSGPGGILPSGNAQQLASQILSNANIALATNHSSGIADSANAKQNITDTAAGNPAARSAYEGAPGGTVPLNANMLAALQAIGNKYKISVSEIAGGSHSSENGKNSTLGHYGGNSFDINYVNGEHLTPGSQYVQPLMDLCKSLGAGQVIDETSTANHVHCGAFPAAAAATSSTGGFTCQPSSSFDCNEPQSVANCNNYYKYGDEYGSVIPNANGAQILRAVMYHESRCQSNLVSTASEPAYGLMQMKVTTANSDITHIKDSCGITATIDGAWFKNNPGPSVCLAAQYLKYLSKQSCGTDDASLLNGYHLGHCPAAGDTCTEAVSQMMACIH